MTDNDKPISMLHYLVALIDTSNYIFFFHLNERKSIHVRKALIELGRLYTIFHFLKQMEPELQQFIIPLEAGFNKWETRLLHVTKLNKKQLASMRIELFEPMLIFIDVAKEQIEIKDT